MKYWVYHEGEVPGAYEPHELAKLTGFTAATLVCPADSAAEDRRWQRAGQFPDIVEALRLHDLQPPPAAPASPAAFVDPAVASSPEDLLNATSHKIFLHVTELMKELENRREERALTQSLQRSLVELKSELHAARERIRFLDDRVSTIPALEERERRALEEAERLRADIRALEEKIRERDARIGQMEQRLHEAALALDNALRGQTEAIREQKRMAQAVEELNRQLALKESTLAKSLAMIRRLESELGQLLPAPAAKAPPPPPAVKAGGTSPAEPPPPPPSLVVAAGGPPKAKAVQAEPLPEIPKLAPNPAPESRAPVAEPERMPEIIPLTKAAEPAMAPQPVQAPLPAPAPSLSPLVPEAAEPAAEEAASQQEVKPGPQPTRDDPKPASPAVQEPATPIPAPWQSALDEVTAFFKRNLPGKSSDDKR